MISGILYECKRAHCTTRVGHVGIKLGSCLLSCLIQIHRAIRQRTLHIEPLLHYILMTCDHKQEAKRTSSMHL